jgi:hypothetical protein
MKNHKQFSRSAFTITETLVASLAFSVVSIGVFIFLNTGLLTFAKNYSTNVSHSGMRDALDRVGNSMNTAASSPELINTNGTVVATGSAPGIRFDQLRGYPYIVTHPGGSGLSASATTLVLTRSVHALSSPPIPTAGDIITLDNSTVRLRVASVTNGVVNGSNRQSHTITLSSAAGTAIPWNSTVPKTATLLRPIAYMVVPNGTRNELRFYPDTHGITNFATTANFVSVCNNIGSGTGDTTPFSLSAVTDFGNRKLINVALRLRVRDYENRLVRSDAKKTTTTMQVNTSFAAKSM